MFRSGDSLHFDFIKQHPRNLYRVHFGCRYEQVISTLTRTVEPTLKTAFMHLALFLTASGLFKWHLGRAFLERSFKATPVTPPALGAPLPVSALFSPTTLLILLRCLVCLLLFLLAVSFH